MKYRNQTEESTAHVYNKKLSKVWKSNLVKSIRIKHANLSNIAEYEENLALYPYSEVDT